MWKEYYTDGVTKRTDSLYICSCSCGKCYWSCTYQKQCSECGRDLISCEPASKKRTAKQMTAQSCTDTTKTHYLVYHVWL